MPYYIFAMAECLTCGQIFACNPDLVPSVRWPQPDGPRQPICKTCVCSANTERLAIGKTAHEILPGAYEASPC